MRPSWTWDDYGAMLELTWRSSLSNRPREIQGDQSADQSIRPQRLMSVNGRHGITVEGTLKGSIPCLRVLQQARPRTGVQRPMVHDPILHLIPAHGSVLLYNK